MKKIVKKVATHGDLRKKEETGRSSFANNAENTKSYAIRRVFYSTVEGVYSHSFVVTLPQATCTNPETHEKKVNAGRNRLTKNAKLQFTFWENAPKRRRFTQRRFTKRKGFTKSERD